MRCAYCHKSFTSIDFSEICLSCQEDANEVRRDTMYDQVKKVELEMTK